MYKFWFFILLAVVLMGCGGNNSGKDEQSSDEFVENVESRIVEMQHKTAGKSGLTAPPKKAEKTASKPSNADPTLIVQDEVASNLTAAEKAGFFVGVDNVKEAMNKVKMDLKLLNSLLSPMTQDYAFSFISKYSYVDKKKSFDYTAKASYNPSTKKNKDRLTILSIVGETGEEDTDFGFKKDMENFISAADRIGAIPMLTYSDFTIQDNTGSKIVLSFNFGKKELPEGFKYFKHLSGEITLTADGPSTANLKNSKHFSALVKYKITVFDCEYTYKNIASGYVLSTYELKLEGKKMTKAFNMTESVIFTDYQVVL